MTTTRTIPGISTGGATNPLKGLLAYGQSPWMDYIRRDLLIGGGLKKYIDSDGLRGMTSNPAIFEKAIAGSNLYNDILNSAEAKKLDANGIFEEIAIRDVQDACDIFKPVYATVTSVWKFPRFLASIPTLRSRKLGACGRPWIARTS